MRFGPSMSRSYSRRMSRPSTPSNSCQTSSSTHRHPTHRQEGVAQQHALDVGIGPRRAAGDADHDREGTPILWDLQPANRRLVQNAPLRTGVQQHAQRMIAQRQRDHEQLAPGLQRHLTDFHHIADGALLAAGKHQEEQGDQHLRAPDQGADHWAKHVRATRYRQQPQGGPRAGELPSNSRQRFPSRSLLARCDQRSPRRAP